MNYATMHLYKMSRTERGRMADIILRYYQIHVPDFPELKSLPVLKEPVRLTRPFARSATAIP